MPDTPDDLPKDFPIIEWFENKEFVEQVIMLGLGEIMKHQKSKEEGGNFVGALTYILDKRHKIDAENIAKIVAAYNKPLWEYGNKKALEEIIGGALDEVEEMPGPDESKRDRGLLDRAKVNERVKRK